MNYDSLFLVGVTQLYANCSHFDKNRIKLYNIIIFVTILYLQIYPWKLKKNGI